MLCVHINLSKILFCAKEKPVPRLVSVRTVKQKKKKTYINFFMKTGISHLYMVQLILFTRSVWDREAV